MATLNVMDPSLMTPEYIAALELRDLRMEINKLTSKNPHEVKNATEELMKAVKDEGLKKELGVVREIAIKRILIEKINKENKKLPEIFDAKTAKYSSYAESYGEAVGDALSKIEELQKERKMTDITLQNMFKGGNTLSLCNNRTSFSARTAHASGSWQCILSFHEL
jgi:archaellum component FlaC